MFSFLNTAVLFAAAAALIPLIIHLFSRRKVKVIEFSSVRYLKSMQRRQVRRLKIRQLLLLILRMLIILAVVLAFARPTRQDGAIGAHATISAVVLFDNSASMNRFVADGNLFDLAKKRTQELLETFGQADQVCLIPLAVDKDEQSKIGFTTRAIATKRLAGVQPSDSRAEMQSALEHTMTLVESAQNLNREIYIITDRQRGSLPEAEVLAESLAKVFFVDLPLEAVDNIGVISLDFGGQLIQVGHDFTVTTTIKNYGAEKETERLASLYLDDKRVAQTEFSAEAGAESSVRFTRTVTQAGFHTGYIELSDDKYPNDNRYYFSFRIPEQSNLLVIGDNAGARYISLALAPAGMTNQYWSIKEATLSELTGIDFADYDVIILSGAPTLQASYVTRIQSFVDRGKSLFLVYGPQTDITNFNAAWSQMSGVTYSNAAPSQFNRTGYYSLKSLDADHPIFSVFGFEENKPPEIKFFALPTLTARPDVRTLVTFTGDRPALVETRYGSGKILTFTGPIEPEYSDLISHGFFVPFISRIAEYLASDLSSFDVRLFVGDNVVRSLTSKRPMAGGVERLDYIA